ncbi:MULTISPECIES: helix-turn-helix domain-containing protein [unclassified Streptomyces]|uniref:helix-turn-helix domain-containing protein n=1 Tax=unclassified Streptomyces TaxID=2593676 RepID=UPI0038037506
MKDIDAIAALQDPVRRRLYEYVAAQGREVGRNEAAEATGVTRTLAAHHLDRLTGAGLLESGSRRLTGRSGPGAGRPAKVYTRARAEHAVSLPSRDYLTAAELLAEAAERAGLDRELRTAARRKGEALRGPAAPCGSLAEAMEALAARGYEPHLEPADTPTRTKDAGSDRAAGAVKAPGAATEATGPTPVTPTAPGAPATPTAPITPGAPITPEAPGAPGAVGAVGPAETAPEAAPAVVRMRNCPFHSVAERFPPLVCGMNLALLEGLLGTGGAVRARMDSRPGECCVVVEDSKNNQD